MGVWRHVWRLGHVNGPCDFIPRHLCSWNNRFDDPLREYRTIYSADRRLTCLREILADLRPNDKVLRDFEKLFGPPTESGLPARGVVSMEWRRAHVVVQAAIVLAQGHMVNIEGHDVQARLQEDLSGFLREHGIARLGKNDLRGRNRVVTQKISRYIFGSNGAGIQFHSRLDEALCSALFEGRASLEPLAPPVSLAEDIPDLLRVCREYRLTLQN